MWHSPSFQQLAHLPASTVQISCGFSLGPSTSRPTLEHLSTAITIKHCLESVHQSIHRRQQVLLGHLPVEFWCTDVRLKDVWGQRVDGDAFIQQQFAVALCRSDKSMFRCCVDRQAWYAVHTAYACDKSDPTQETILGACLPAENAALLMQPCTAPQLGSHQDMLDLAL